MSQYHLKHCECAEDLAEARVTADAIQEHLEPLRDLVSELLEAFGCATGSIPLDFEDRARTLGCHLPTPDQEGYGE